MRRALTMMFVLLAACPVPQEAVPPPPKPEPIAAPLPCLRITPESLDFGEVENALGRALRIQVTNISGFLKELSSKPAPPGFLLSQPLNLTSVQLPADATRNLEVLFQPGDARLHLEQLEFNAGPDCVTMLPLRGLGSGSVSTPSLLDFGFLAPGQPRTLELTISNSRRVAVTLNSLRLEVKTTQAFSARLPSQVELLPMSSVSFPVTAIAPTDDTFVAEFVGLSPFGITRAQLQVVGGAPVAALSQTQVTIPKVGFYPGSRPSSFAERVVFLQNASTVGRSLEAQLRVVAPFTKVEALDGGESDELSVTIADAGLTLGAASAVLLRLKPTSVGPRSYRVTLFTNDPVSPEQTIFFGANVESLPECALSIDPQELVLRPSPDGGAEGSISFVNMGVNPCVLDDVRLSTPSTFQLIPESQVTIAAGATHVITVHGPRAGDEGSLGFHVFNAGSVRQFVRLITPH